MYSLVRATPPEFISPTSIAHPYPGANARTFSARHFTINEPLLTQEERFVYAHHFLCLAVSHSL